MVNQDLINYIQKKLETNSSKEEIKYLLVSNGWKEEIIEEAFSLIKIEEIKKPEEPQITITRKMNSSKPSALDFPKFPEIKEVPRKKTPIAVMALGLFSIIIIVIFSIIQNSRQPMINLFKALEKGLEIQSLETKSELKITIDDALLSQIKENYEVEIEKEHTLNSQFSFDLIDRKDIKGKNNIILDNKIVNADFVFLNNTLYGILNSFTIDLTRYGFTKKIVDLFFEKWFKVINIEEKGLSSQIEENIQKTENKYKEYIDIFKKHPKIISKIKKLQSGKNINRYKIEINKQELLNILKKDYALSNLGRELSEEETARIQEILQYININNLEIWIDANNDYVSKIVIDINVDNISWFQVEAKEGGVRIQYTLDLYNHNKQLKVSEPKNFDNLEELLNKVNDYYTKDASIKVRLEQLKTNAEIYKSINNQYSIRIINATGCNNPLAFSATFLANKNDAYKTCQEIQKESTGNLKIIINNLKGENAKYCIQKTLNDGRAWCVDYTGFSGYEENCDKINFDCKNP